MDCTICHKPVNLIPSASDRAARFGGKPADYVRIFTTHPACALRKRQEETAVLMEIERERRAANVVKLHSGHC